MGGCFASTTKTARNSVFGGEIIQNVGLLAGGSIYIYIYIYIRLYILEPSGWTLTAQHDGR